MTGKELVQVETGKSHPRVWFLAGVILLLLEAEGILMATVTGWDLPVNAPAVYLGTAVSAVLASLFFYEGRLEGKRRYLVFLFVLLYAGLLFVTQDTFLSGGKQFVNAVVSAVNREYNSSIAVFSQTADAGEMTVFLLEIMLVLTGFLASVVLWRPDALILALAEFPILAVMFLCAGEPSMPALFFLLFGAVGTYASSRSFRRKALWGTPGSEQRKRNLECFENVQKKILIAVGTAGVVLSIFAFYLVRPGLNVQLERAESVAARVENRIMESLIALLPQSENGGLSLTAETDGGGVQDGMLGETDGFAVGSLEDLRLTSSVKPSETVYLKGFIGSTYGENRWLAPSGETFFSAASNWQTEDDPALYIQNLPFLRTMYALNMTADGENGEDASAGSADGGENSGVGALSDGSSGGMAAAPAELTVERLNAVSSYTYVPYNAYLNEYYDIPDGDGAVAGQSVQDDIFSWFPEETSSSVLEAWNSDEENAGVLDRVEASYEAYARQWYMDVPEGLDELKELCEEQEFHVEETGDVPADGVDDVAEFVIPYLTENYTYDMNAEAVPEGEDFLTYFLEESKTGYSTHFATAAVVMFRMCGLPARYVAGYAVPADLFAVQPDGTYTAVAQADNSHAWVEVYQSGVGWVPVETTPGALGTKAQVEMPEGTEQNGADEDGSQENGTEEDGNNPFSDFVSRLLDGSLDSVIFCMEIVSLVAVTGAVSGHLIWKRRCHLGKRKRLSVNENIREIFRAFYEVLLYAGMDPSIASDDPRFAETAERYCGGAENRLEPKGGKQSGARESGARGTGTENPASCGEIREFYALVLEAVYGDTNLQEKDLIRARKYYRELVPPVLRQMRFIRRIKAVVWRGY